MKRESKLQLTRRHIRQLTTHQLRADVQGGRPDGCGNSLHSYSSYNTADTCDSCNCTSGVVA
jgi:hypothetical protein